MIPWNPKFLRYCTPLIRMSKDINWRFGRKYRCSSIDIETLRTVLKPGMILLTRKEFQLSNLFIDGYWTHSGILTLQDKVIEAISNGVIITELKDFCRKSDSFVILKPRFCTWLEMEKASHLASEMVGSPYSYDFNNSDSSYYCSKLVLKAYSCACDWNRNHYNVEEEVPGEYRLLCDGKIVHPIDFFRNQNAWEVVFQQN
jgi:uncharacterized protein YycO